MGTKTFHTFYLIQVIDVLCEMTWVHVIHGAEYEGNNSNKKKKNGHVTMKHVHICCKLACIIQRRSLPIEIVARDRSQETK